MYKCRVFLCCDREEITALRELIFIFSKEYFFRYSDLDYRDEIKISAVIDILQDISILHSAAVGFSREKLTSISVAWLLLGWRIRFIEPLDKDKGVDVRTGIMSLHKFEGVRKYEMYQDGVCKVCATAVWFTVDTEKMKVTKVPDEIYDAYESVNEPDNGLEFIKLRGTEDIKAVSNVTVERRDIDTNKHLNNVKSVELALDCLPENIDISELQITYRKSIFMNEHIQICVKNENGDYFVELKTEKNQPGVMINAILKKE